MSYENKLKLSELLVLTSMIAMALGVCLASLDGRLLATVSVTVTGLAMGATGHRIAVVLDPVDARVRVLTS